MGLIFWDAALRGGAISLFALLAFLFVRDWRTSLTARLGAVTCLGGVAYVALIAIDTAGPTLPWRLPFHLMSLATPALFWVFALSWFDGRFSLAALACRDGAAGRRDWLYRQLSGLCHA